jgi:hypothetical protein
MSTTYPSYTLLPLFERGEIKIKRCPRCGGLVYWPYQQHLAAQDKKLFIDKIKCFSCSRIFYLKKNGERPSWAEYPDRDEKYDIVFEDECTKDRVPHEREVK